MTEKYELQKKHFEEIQNRDNTDIEDRREQLKENEQNEKKRQKDQEKAARRKATRKEYQRKVPIEDSQPRMAEEFGTEEEEEEEEEDTHEQTITAVTDPYLPPRRLC